jgi:uncharacterized protein
MIKMSCLTKFHTVLKRSFLIALGLLLFTGIQAQQAKMYDEDIPDRPKPPRLVNDFADMLTADEESMLEEKLVGYNDTTSTQIAVVTVPNLGVYPVEEYSLRLGRKWGIGEKDKNNGILILISKEDRKIDIGTGYGVGQYVSDIDAQRMINELIKPAFKQGNYFEGINATVDRMILLLSGGFVADFKASDGKIPIGSIIFIVIILVIFVYTTSRRSSQYTYKKGGYSGGPFWGGGFGGGGFGGGSSDGGGFGGFGGGSFGGGGASGDW